MTTQTADAKKIDTRKVISWLPIQPYHHVADVGCGGGYFTIPFAKHVYLGKVSATDVSQEKLDATGESLKDAHLGNVDLMMSKEKKLPLEDESVDGAFFSRMLHHAKDYKALLKEGMRCVRKTGWLAMIELHKKEMDGAHPVDELIDEAELRATAEEVGFRFSARHDVNNRYYVLVMRK